MPQQFQEIDIPSIREAEFTPEPPPRLTTSLNHALTFFPSATLSALHSTDRSLGYFTTTPLHEAPGEVLLTVVVTKLSPEEQVVLVLDTLTHMSKHDLSPFLLMSDTHEGLSVHYGCFRIHAALRATIGFIRSTAEELSQLTSRAHWKTFFGATEPLEPSFTHTAVPLSPQEAQRTTHQVLPTVLEPLHPTSPGLHPASPPNDDQLHHTQLPGIQADEHITCWLMTPPKPQRLLIVCDGATYRHHYPLWPAIQTINANHPHATTALLLIEPGGQLTRDQFLGDRPYLPRWLSETCLPWVQTHIDVPPASHCTIAGGSLGGLAAAQTVKAIPHLLENAIVQSASFWWQGADRLHPEGHTLYEWLEDTLPPNITLFCEVGEYEGFLLSWNRAFHRILTQRAVKHTYREYCGGHDYACWRQGILDALLLQLNPSLTPQTGPASSETPPLVLPPAQNNQHRPHTPQGHPEEQKHPSNQDPE